LIALAVIAANSGSASTPSKPHMGAVAFDRIASIVQNNCTSCHSSGGAAPFELTTYQDVKDLAADIAEATGSRAMPPWIASPRSGPFINERRLSDAQISLIRRWAEGGAPPARPDRLVEKATKTADWPLGQPDIVLTMDEPYIHGSHVDQTYRNFIMPLHTARDLWLRAATFRPSRPENVEFAALFLDNAGVAKQLQVHSGAVGYGAFEAGLGDNADRLVEWSNDSAPQTFPRGVAQRIPAGSDLVLLIHFRETDPPASEQSQVGLYISAQPPRRQAQTIHFGLAKIYLDAKEKATVTDSFTLPAACEILRLMPHGHPTVRSMHLNAYLPNGSVRSVVEFDDWIARWQEPLTFVRPLRLPAGTRLLFRCNADNTKGNPRNPYKPAHDAIPTFDDMDAMAQLDVVVAPESPADNDALKTAVSARPVTVTIYQTDALEGYLSLAPSQTIPYSLLRLSSSRAPVSGISKRLPSTSMSSRCESLSHCAFSCKLCVTKSRVPRSVSTVQ
jgi:hypothetical protein